MTLSAPADAPGATDFAELAQAMRAEVEPMLAALAVAEGGCPDSLAEAIRYSLLAPGKRLRPLLVLMAAEACGCQRSLAIPAACAVEMIHAYSLIHDDLPAMDDDDLRRGQPTCHVQFDEATAILAGDALLTRAFGVLAEAPWPAEVRSRCVAELAQAAGTAGMVGGQADDLAAEKTNDLTPQLLESIHHRKTGALIRVSLRLGAIVAEANDEQLDALHQYGRCLGMAFQITDDLLDHEGDEQQIGKRTGKDADRGKLTFVRIHGPAAAREQAADLIDAACESLSPFGDAASSLDALARYVLQRKQ